MLFLAIKDKKLLKIQRSGLPPIRCVHFCKVLSSTVFGVYLVGGMQTRLYSDRRWPPSSPHCHVEKLIRCILPPCIAAHWCSACVLVNLLEVLSLLRMSGLSDHPFIFALAGILTWVVFHAGLEVLLCPQLWKSGEHIAFWLVRACVCPSVRSKKNIKARVFEISYMDSSSKKSLPVFFFLSKLSPFAELWPF